MARKTIDIDFGGGHFEVTFFSKDVKIWDSSIGSYDYHGYIYHDNQPKRVSVLSFGYDDYLFEDSENEIISNYAKENEYSILEYLTEIENEYI